ncbi:MAG: hypothetical protein OHK0029_40210 [Armatimonadaceae bacterium]
MRVRVLSLVLLGLTVLLLGGCSETPEATPATPLTSKPQTTPPPFIIERERARAVERQKGPSAPAGESAAQPR